MKILFLFILSIFTIGCVNIKMVDNNYLYLKAFNGQLSCYANKCCFPYKEKIMICTTEEYNKGMLYFRYKSN